MEFVEGETLENLIKRSGRLEVKLALEIVTQTAAGLAAVHKQNLVHRDIKPSNIMVSVEEGCNVTAKIIDLGLAKTLGEPGAQTAISTPGGFAGTPEFASPEQFAGVGVDIRSDLYSLGVTLWEMVTGQAPFQGSPAEVMYQHQHASLPLDRLKRVSQPVVVLLEVLLEKDPGRRFQNPAELVKAMPTITGAIDAGRRITRKSLQNMAPAASPLVTRKPPRLGQFVSFILGRANVLPSNTEGGSPVLESSSPGSVPKKISVARLPVTGSDVFGREEDIAFLDDAWANQDVNVVTIVAWAGVGKSTLINHWLRRMAAKHYCSAELVFGWSFYRQGTSGSTSSADEFLDATLTWFGDPDPRLGTAWEKGERLAKLIAHRRTLLVLDGLEPLQNPPGPQEGRLREPSLQALLRELAALSKGLCVITTRAAVADIADYERTSALRRDLEQLSSDAGAQLLRALGVKGHEAELRSASDEFRGHGLALTLLGSYLTEAYNGDVRCREEVSAHLAHDLRQGAHARKVMESYQSWLGEGPELAILRMLGLFDRPADEQTFGVLLKPPAIPGLTEALTDSSPTEWRAILARLRRTRLLAGEDPHNPGQLDTHPLVREYFGEQLRSQQTDAWKECSRRLYYYYQTLAPQLPNSFREMEPLFSAVICGCNAGLFRDALHEVYISRIQRSDAHFAAKVLGATGPLLSALMHFFADRRWGSLVETAAEGQSLTAEDRLFILMQAAKYLTTTRGMGAPEARICYERAEPLCQSLNQPRLECLALRGQWRYCLMMGKLSVAIQIAERGYSLAQEQNDAALKIGACAALAANLFFLGDFESARRHAKHGVQIWRSGGVKFPPEDLDTPVVGCLCHGALSEWHLGEIASCKANVEEAISLAKELNDMNALALALEWAAMLGNCQRNPAEVDRFASEMVELSTRHNFVFWLAVGSVYRGWARSISGDKVEGISRIEQALSDWRTIGSTPQMSYYLALKAEALHLADRTSEALKAINEAEALAERFENRYCCAELNRLHGVFLAVLGADEAQIEASFGEAISIAKEQKSISLEKRAEATYAEYRRQKASGSGGRGFRLPLW
jgi:tetratricopeptide (TPR) repeat protein